MTIAAKNENFWNILKGCEPSENHTRRSNSTDLGFCPEHWQAWPSQLGGGGDGQDCGVPDFFTFKKLYQKVKQHNFWFWKIVDSAKDINKLNLANLVEKAMDKIMDTQVLQDILKRGWQL